MEGRTLRVRAPVNYKAENSGTNTPGWLKSKTTTRVFSEEKTELPAKADKDKENNTQGQRDSKKQSPKPAGTTKAFAAKPLGPLVDWLLLRQLASQ